MNICMVDAASEILPTTFVLYLLLYSKLKECRQTHRSHVHEPEVKLHFLSFSVTFKLRIGPEHNFKSWLEGTGIFGYAHDRLLHSVFIAFLFNFMKNILHLKFFSLNFNLLMLENLKPKFFLNFSFQFTNFILLISPMYN